MPEGEAVAAPLRAAPQRPLRPRELEDPLNLHLYHPLAWQLARLLAPTAITPNMVSVAGGLTVVLAAVAYVGPLWGLAWPASAALGLALHMAWHVIDGADGDLARLTGRASPRGEMIDGVCDYASHVVLYVLLGLLLQRTLGPAAWAITVAAGAAHIVQSVHVESQRRFYLSWVHGKPWLLDAPPPAAGVLGALAALYLEVARGLTPAALAIDRAVTAARGDPERLAALRALIRAESGPLLRIEKWLGANSRALVLGASMLLTAGPLAYFLYGGVWMTLLLLLSIRLHDRAARRVAARIADLG